MPQPTRLAALAVVCALAVAVAWSAWPLAAQAPRQAAADLRRRTTPGSRFGGTRLSDDGQWLAYALTSQAEDGELIVRNLKSGAGVQAPARHRRRSSRPDGKFVIFTIVPPKAEDDDERAGARNGGAGGARRRRARRRPRRRRTRSAPAAQLGRHHDAAGRAGDDGRADRDASGCRQSRRRGSRYHKGRAGGAGGGRGGGAWRRRRAAAARRRRRGGRRRRRRRRRSAGGAGAPAQQAAQRPAAQARDAAGEAQGSRQRSDPPQSRDRPGRHDPRSHRIRVGQDRRLARLRGVVDRRGEGRRVRAPHERRHGDARSRAARGHYKSLAFDEAGTQIAFLSDQADYEKPVSPYRLYYWKAGDAAAVELVSAATRGMPQGMVVSDDFAPRFSEDGARLHPRAPRRRRRRRPIRTCGAGADSAWIVWSYKDPQIQPMQQVRATQERNRNYRAVVHLSDKRFVQLATPDCRPSTPAPIRLRAIGTSDSAVPAGDVVGHDLQRRLPRRPQDRRSAARCSSTAAAARRMSPGGKYLLYFDEPTGHWFTYHIATARASNLTERLPVKFYDESHDTPSLPPAPRIGRLDRRRQVGAAERPVRHLGNPARRHERAQ